jgi:hypothetical protein
MEDFANAEECKDAADKLIALFSELYPRVAQQYPPKLVDGHWRLDEFYYIDQAGDIVLSGVGVWGVLF